MQVRGALEAAEPDFSSSRTLCNTEYCVAQDLPAVPGIDPEGVCRASTAEVRQQLLKRLAHGIHCCKPPEGQLCTT